MAGSLPPLVIWSCFFPEKNYPSSLAGVVFWPLPCQLRCAELCWLTRSFCLSQVQLSSTNPPLLGNCSKKFFNVCLNCSSYEKCSWLCLGILTVESILGFGAVPQLFKQDMLQVW